uniref:Uncharacterized protein n=2 Tax=Aegilops tauschii TaxID=37682 RepID=M8C7L3_AEGTA
MIGHILSFLDAKEAARAAALSSRWRDVFASVHTVSLEQPDRPLYDYDADGDDSWHKQNIARPFVATVTDALFARSRRPDHAAAAVPLRALRVCMDGGASYFKVARWISYALRYAGPDLELDLRLARDPVCWGIDFDPRDFGLFREDANLPDENDAVAQMPPDIDPVDPILAADACRCRQPKQISRPQGAASRDDEMPGNRLPQPPRYIVPELPTLLFSCVALRSLRLGYCILSMLEVINLPSLQSLHITRVRNKEEHVQRLISGCPLLADLTLEACSSLTALCLVDNTRLRRLALRLCDNLANVAIDASGLLSFEYLGAIPDSSFLTISGGGGGGFPAITSCKIDTFVVLREEVEHISFRAITWRKIDTDVGSREEAEVLLKLASFLQLFVSTKHLHLCSTRMGSYFVNLPEFSSLTHLELNGRVLQDDDPALAMAVTSIILGQAPNLELLTLVFQPGPQESRYYGPDRSEGELLDMHLLHYDKHATIDDTLMVSMPVPSCLMNRVSKIELVHYQGGTAQRTLAKFLLGNALALKTLYCGFAEGPEWIQMELMHEMEDWVIANKEFC